MGLDVSDVGRRVVVRHRLPAQALLTDVIGVLEAVDATSLAVRRADGTLVAVPTVDVVAAKPVPARTVTRRAVRTVEAVATRGWPGLEQERLGGWVLRAGGGFTRRANSLLPLGPADRLLDEAVATASAWYAERGLPARFALPTLLGAELDALLARRGWPAGGGAVVLTARLDDALAAAGSAEVVRGAERVPAVEVTGELDDAWLAVYHYRGGPLPGAAPAVLSAVDGEVGFARLRVDGEVLAVGRGAVSGDPSGRPWLGLAAVEVAAAARRRGLGRRVVAALLRWGAVRGARQAYLQVEDGNAPGRRLYEGLGFTEHHRYAYRQPSGTD